MNEPDCGRYGPGIWETPENQGEVISIFLEEHLRRKVDVVSKRGLRSEIRESVLKEAIPI